jgi:hypothetical protein
VSHGPLLESFVLGTHAADTAEVKGTKNPDYLRAFAHYFMERHVFGNSCHCVSPV